MRYKLDIFGWRIILVKLPIRVVHGKNCPTCKFNSEGHGYLKAHPPTRPLPSTPQPITAPIFSRPLTKEEAQELYRRTEEFLRFPRKSVRGPACDIHRRIVWKDALGLGVDLATLVKQLLKMKYSTGKIIAEVHHNLKITGRRPLADKKELERRIRRTISSVRCQLKHK